MPDEVRDRIADDPRSDEPAAPRLAAAAARLGGGAAVAADGGLHPRDARARGLRAGAARRRETSYDAVVEALLAHRRAGGCGGLALTAVSFALADALRPQRLRGDRQAAALAAHRPGRRRRLRGRPDRGLRPAERRRDPAALLHAARHHPRRHRPRGGLRHHRLRRRPRRHRRAGRALARRDARAASSALPVGVDRRGGRRHARRRRRCSSPPAGGGSRCPGSGGGIDLPARALMLRQFAVTALDTAAAAGVLWVLLPAGSIGYLAFLPLFAVALVARHPQPRPGRARRLRGGAARRARRRRAAGRAPRGASRSTG